MKLVDSPPAGYERMQIYGLLHLTQSIVCLYCTCQDVLYLISVRIVYRRRWRWRWCCASWPRCSSPHMCSWPYQRGGPVWWSDCGRWWCRSSCHLRDLWPPHSLTTPPEKRRKKKKKKRGEHNVKKKSDDRQFWDDRKKDFKQQRWEKIWDRLTSLNCREITPECLNSYSFSCLRLPSQIAASARIRGTIVYVPEVPLQKVNIYHALFLFSP